jgi:hypothetical protein
VVSFSRNVVLGELLFSINLVSKPRMLSVRGHYVLSSLHLGGSPRPSRMAWRAHSRTCSWSSRTRTAPACRQSKSIPASHPWMRSARAIGLSRARRSFAAATRNFDGLCSALIFCFSEPHRRWVRLRLPVPAIGAAEKWSRRSQKDQDNLPDYA